VYSYEASYFDSTTNESQSGFLRGDSMDDLISKLSSDGWVLVHTLSSRFEKMVKGSAEIRLEYH
jgi:hypothetical protein